jgi:hypothetical protein
VSRVSKDAIYEIADRLLVHKGKLEAALRNQEARLFPSQTTLFLYDLTNTYLEGQGKNNALVKRGKSKEKRSDARLSPWLWWWTSVDLILSRIYGGKQSEPKTLPEIVSHLYVSEEPDPFEQKNPMIAMDQASPRKATSLCSRRNACPVSECRTRAERAGHGHAEGTTVSGRPEATERFRGQGEHPVEGEGWRAGRTAERTLSQHRFSL